MAVVFTEGFDYYNGIGFPVSNTAAGLLTRWISAATTRPDLTYDMVAGRFGGQALRCEDPNSTISVAVPSTYSSGCVGFALKLSGGDNSAVYGLFGVSTNPPNGALGSGARSQFYITVNTAGQVVLYRPTSVVLATSTTTVPFGVWSYIEVEFVISATVGEVRVYLNNNPTPIINVSGVNNKAQTGSGFSYLAFASPASIVTADIDDIYFTDTPTRLGEQRVITSYVNGDSSTDFWSSSTGGAAPYTMLDETVCDADVTYVSSNTTNSRIVLTVPALPVPPTAVNAVQIVGFARKDETQFRQVALEYQNTAGAVSTGATYTLNTSYVYMQNLYVQNPLTGAPWTATDVNSMKIGARVVS